MTIPRHSILYNHHNLVDEIGNIDLYLEKGIKVLWFGTAVRIKEAILKDIDDGFPGRWFH